MNGYQTIITGFAQGIQNRMESCITTPYNIMPDAELMFLNNIPPDCKIIRVQGKYEK
jgi:hypothetical protein